MKQEANSAYEYVCILSKPLITLRKCRMQNTTCTSVYCYMTKDKYLVLNWNLR